MFDSSGSGFAPAGAAHNGTVLDASMVVAFKTLVSGGTDCEATDTDRIDEIRALEELQCAAAARQALLTREFDESQRAAGAGRGVKQARQGRGVALQVGLARRESHHRGKQHLGLARVVPTEMPHTWRAFRAGRISEYRVQLLARETACLSLADRRRVDSVLAGDPDALESMGDRELVAEAKKLAYRLDPESVIERRSRAEKDRRVTIRPAPDVMSRLSALLPVAQGVGVYATLTRHADRLRGAGDSRTRGQIMADTLVEQVMRLNSSTASTTRGAPVAPVSVNIVISDRALLAGADDPAHLEGYGPIPAAVARQLVRQAEEAGVAAIRRLYARPGTGELVAMDSRARIFPAALSRFLRLRDQTCRTPWCDAPIRHSDHVEEAASGGPTSAANGQGLCAACNLAKQAFGWQARPRPGPRHTVETRTPTGHRYRSTAPAPPGSGTGRSRMDVHFADLVLAS